MLDTWHLDLGAVTDGDGNPLPHELGEHDEILGSPLAVELGPAGTGPDRVVVHYATTEDAQALQWLDPAQSRLIAAGGEAGRFSAVFGPCLGMGSIPITREIT